MTLEQTIAEDGFYITNEPVKHHRLIYLCIKTLITVYNSWIADKIDDYNSSFYYDSADCIYQSYLIGKPL